MRLSPRIEDNCSHDDRIGTTELRALRWGHDRPVLKKVRSFAVQGLQVEERSDLRDLIAADSARRDVSLHASILFCF